MTATQRRTTIGRDGTTVTLVEHVLAALSGLRIDNCVIEINGPEPPGLDGSAVDFCKAIQAAQPQLLPEQKAIYTVTEPVQVQSGGATLTFHPANYAELQLKISYLLDYGTVAPIPRQTITMNLNPATFQQDFAPCRTFLLEHEVQVMRSHGVGNHLSPADLLVFGARGPINNILRFANEPARHKALDLVGDLALTGQDWVGHLVAYRSGHDLNVSLARKLCQLSENDELTRGLGPSA